MKHAETEALSQLEGLLAGLRSIETLKEKRPGVLYLRSRAFLHFHEDPTGLFVDIRLSGEDFTRLPVNTPNEREKVLRVAQTAMERGR